MALQIIHVIRERSDQGSRLDRQARCFYCSGDADVSSAQWEPNTDIIECEDYVLIRLEVPGIQREDIAIHLKNGRLEIRGVRRENRPEDPVHYHQMEIAKGPFLKVIAIPEDIEHNDISAVLAEGVLDVKISKNNTVIEIPVLVQTAEKQ
jgi:HSP20 family protein